MSNHKKERQRWKNPQFVTGRYDFGNTHTTLLPGEQWHPLDGVPAPEYIPEDWDWPHVSLRLQDAFRTLASMPDRGGAPRIAPAFWPEIWVEWEDLLAQEQKADVKAEAARRANRVRIRPSAQEITRMETVICWPGEHLTAAGQVDLARIVQRVAFYRSLDLDMEYVARRMKQPPKMLRAANKDGLEVIAAGLRRARVPIF